MHTGSTADGRKYDVLCEAIQYPIDRISIKRIVSNNSPRRRLFRSVALHLVHLHVVQCRTDRFVHGRRDKTFATNTDLKIKSINSVQCKELK